MTETQNRLDERYGRTARSAKTNRTIGVVAGIGFAAVLGTWLWWGGVLETPSQLQYRDVAHTIVDDTEVSVTYEITAAPGTEVSCAVHALNASYGIVGWRIVDIPAGERWTRVFDTTLRTSEPAVTGLLYECWLP
ncbi:MAG: DUF4307 domain-containing protein [Pontimonas sp.]